MDKEIKVVEVINLTKNFGRRAAVSELSFDVFRGDVFGFLGPNGAGKSTTIKMLLSLIHPTSGDIQIFGRPLSNGRKYILSRTGAIVENPDFYLYLSAYKNLEILGEISGLKPDKKKIMDSLEFVGLAERAKSRVKTYSHGMRQRLGIAQALLHDPELIILDEPATGMDPQGIREIRQLILNLKRELNKTVIISSHILSEIELIVDRMIILNKGRKIIEGNVEDILNSGEMKVMFRLDSAEKAKSLIDDSKWKSALVEVADDKFYFMMSTNLIPELNYFLADNSISVYSIVPKRSLEEYFLKITEDSN